MKTIASQIRTIAKMDAYPLTNFQTLAGKLQHASFDIPGGKYLFSPLYKAIQFPHRLSPLPSLLKITLLDWRTIIRKLTTSPTPMQLLVPNYPDLLQYMDACGLSCGGILSPGLSTSLNIVWQWEWPKKVKERFYNRDISIMDLELIEAERIVTELSE